jgi:hypothetical protein
MADGWTGTAPPGSFAGPPTAPGLLSQWDHTRCGTHSSPQRWTPGVAARRAGSRLARRSPHADPRTTLRYDRARGSLDRHAIYIVAAYVAGAAR